MRYVLPIQLVRKHLGSGCRLNRIPDRAEFEFIGISPVRDLLFGLVFNKIPSDLAIGVKF
ncbi:hypothetical protein CCB80_05505 [Armatimonadetes bacterium Uphvl-Ar1]|nr:hypothetical protein CCB80_05505 [Armatimonadetes bacterium Uphvl-Ar1]